MYLLQQKQFKEIHIAIHHTVVRTRQRCTRNIDAMHILTAAKPFFVNEKLAAKYLGSEPIFQRHGSHGGMDHYLPADFNQQFLSL